MRIAIQGLDGSYHSAAARRLYGKNIELIFCRTFKQTFEVLAKKQADKAIVAIENSLYGSINEVYDLLLKYQFCIESEVYEQVGLYLLGSPDTTLKNITDVYSQAPALAEAELFLDENMPNAERHEYSDTAMAAQHVSEWSDPSKVAIASSVAAELYNLTIVAKNIETHHQNYTRFLALDPNSKTKIDGADKTSITFRATDVAGSLHTILGVFAKRSINLSKIESRPVIGQAWKYMYYIDFNTAITDELLQELTEHAYDIHVLGCYKNGADRVYEI